MRLKRFLEMRGADGGPWRLICALPALWVGLIYERQAQAEALELISSWSQEERDYLREGEEGSVDGVWMLDGCVYVACVGSCRRCPACTQRAGCH